MQQRVERHGVAHHVAGECATVARLERVLVNPLAITERLVGRKLLSPLESS